MLGIPDILKLAKVDRHPGEDVIDRLNFGTSVYLIAFFAILTGTKQHFGSPIQCLVPPESPDSWVNYYHDYCYIQDKLKIRKWRFGKSETSTQRIQSTRTRYDKTPFEENQAKTWVPTIVYYQWVPYILFLQALFFLFPKLLWTLLGTYICNGGELESVIEESAKFRGIQSAGRADGLKSLASFILDSLQWRRNRGIFGRCALSTSYVLTKWFMVVNVLGQLYMLSFFVGEGNHLWGLDLFLKIINEKFNDPTSGMFPRIVECVTSVAAMSGGYKSNIHNVSMQCVLMQNFINEKIFGFLYFWLIFVAVLTIFSTLRYSLMLILPYYRNCVADALLPTQEVLFSSAAAGLGIHTNPCHERGLMEYFINTVLRVDGVFLLMFINNHAGGLVTHDISHQLWLLAVQPPMKVADGADVKIVDPEYGETTESIQGMPWPYNIRRMSLAKDKQLNGSAHKWDAQKEPLMRGRSRSLSDGTLVDNRSRLPSAPSQNSSEIDVNLHCDDNSTLPLNSTLHQPTGSGSGHRRGVALFDNRNRRNH